MRLSLRGSIPQWKPNKPIIRKPLTGCAKRFAFSAAWDVYELSFRLMSANQPNYRSAALWILLSRLLFLWLRISTVEPLTTYYVQFSPVLV